MSKKYRHLLFALFLSLIPGCIVPGFLYDSYFNFMNFSIDPTSTSSATVVDLDDNETELLTDGPVDLPVTIAKLDSPDIEKITISVTGSPAQLSHGDPQSLHSGGRIFVIEGAAGAVYEEDTPKLTGFAIDENLSVESASQVVTTVADDGSFTIEIASDEDVVFAGLTEDEDAMSPFLLVKEDPATGQFVVITTNSNNIDKTAQLATDSAGFYYLSLSNSGGTQDFIRRNTDGTEVEVIKGGITDPVNRVSAPTQNAIATLTDAGELNLILPSSLPSLVRKEPLALEIVSLTTNLASGYDTLLAKMGLTADNDGALISESGSNSFLHFVRAQSGLVITIISEGRYEDVKWALSPNSQTLYVFILHEGAYVLNSVDMTASNLRTAWANRTKIFESSDFDEILSLEAGNNGTLTFSADSGSTNELYFYSSASGVVSINNPATDSNVYANPVISTGGDFIFACKMGNESQGTGNQLVYHRPGTDTAGTLNPLTTFTEHSACDENPGSISLDNNDFLHFYFKNASGNTPQHALIKASEL